MDATDAFWNEDLSLEEAVQAAEGSRPLIFIDLRDFDAIVGVRDGDGAPVFTHAPVGLRDGFGVGADGVFQALDAMPPPGDRGAHRPTVLSRGVPLVHDARTGLLGALANLAKEAHSHADC